MSRLGWLAGGGRRDRRVGMGDGRSTLTTASSSKPPWLDPGGAQTRRHVFDGGRSRAIRQGLEPLLEDCRQSMRADIAVALHVPGRGSLGVLAAAGERALLPLVNEAVRCVDTAGRTVSLDRAHVVQDVILSAHDRPWRLGLSSALLIPWADQAGRGVVLLGVVPGHTLAPSLGLAGAYDAAFEAVHREASYRGTMRLADDLAAACKAVDRAELEATESGELLTSIASIARGLLGTSAAYVAMADRDAEAFPFLSLVGIKTGSFRRLRMAHDQGLGGLARRERRTVRTLDYGADQRLQEAPVQETQDEGIVSAMCTPLIVDGALHGTLYLGDRHMRAFSDTDSEILTEFAEHAGMRLSRQHVEEHRISVLRHRERERLASMLHDSVVRSLVEIGYNAQAGRLTATDPSLQNLLTDIGAAAGSTLSTLRTELASLGGLADRGHSSCAGQLIEALRLMPRRPDVERSFELRGLQREHELPERLVHALTSVGEEAITNAEHHSGCTSEHVMLEQTDTHLKLVISDNGRGLDAGAAERALAEGSGHLGLRNMRAVTRALGGYTRLADLPDGHGTQMVAVLPLLRESRAL